ncbi:MAG TPA: methylenetetrahydrofolate--tRNA-(uracil(54)-C(5))-methyltransferase (FADH(2)-oxidizing) TrmFO [Oligoflexia bacterium]|nr:methylenetetrahydrofolate--tRNA-(uracil(54)-C(5))-methyltransferase (FADH(2)-oxidizing) TrmFO [Oligoflexia bacterium]HMR24609.1 methylenetetrahydrofolate--tRNA-(uracil(54)-C(5))-methyltransferase (FADH(2)-oxidizing) TrmFO [Oligoflexia bacterium]
MDKKINVVGAGMAGSEAAFLLAEKGFLVTLWEMRPKVKTPAHETDKFAEVVCSNSLGADNEFSAGKILKDEMRAFNSIVLEAAAHSTVPAGKALAVDREQFASYVTHKISKHPKITIKREELKKINADEIYILSTGPLTSDALAEEMKQYLNRDSLYFYDSISPIIEADSIDLEQCYFASRYEQDNDDYLNCPLNQEQYETLIADIKAAEKVEAHNFEELKCFESCMPIEVIVDRGDQTLAFGPMKPVGLPDPKTGKIPYAVLQLRRENDPTTMYNMVGFQTRMKWGEQKRIFRKIPGLQEAEFVRMGSLHRNTYIDSPDLLNSSLQLKAQPNIYFAGQITGVEGYVESAAMGQWAALSLVARLTNQDLTVPPKETAMGALIRYITEGPLHGDFAPINTNFGLFPPLELKKKLRKKDRRIAHYKRAKEHFAQWYPKVAGTF